MLIDSLTDGINGQALAVASFIYNIMKRSTPHGDTPIKAHSITYRSVVCKQGLKKMKKKKRPHQTGCCEQDINMALRILES